MPSNTTQNKLSTFNSLQCLSEKWLLECHQSGGGGNGSLRFTGSNRRERREHSREKCWLAEQKGLFPFFAIIPEQCLAGQKAEQDKHAQQGRPVLGTSSLLLSRLYWDPQDPQRAVIKYYGDMMLAPGGRQEAGPLLSCILAGEVISLIDLIIQACLRTHFSSEE